MSARRVLVALGHVFFKVRDLLFPVAFLAVILGSRPMTLGGNRLWDIALDVAGIGIIAAGQALRILVIGYRYIRRGGKDRRIHADDLVTGGFFAHSRNPLYLGNLMAVAGFCLIHDSLLCYLVGLPFFLLAYLAITAAEEDYLRGRFGEEYEDYCRNVNRFVPSLRGIGRTLEGMEFNWKRVIRKEYGATAVLASGVLLLLGWDAYLRDGWPEVRSTWIVLGALWVPVVVGYFCARTAKMRGWLGGAHALWPRNAANTD